jgi:RHS repeat-associated protein
VKDEVGYRLTVTDGQGTQTRYYTDGLERVILVEKQDVASAKSFRVVQERAYNEYGQYIQAVEVDWLRTSGQPTEQRTVADLQYDDWGQVCRVTENGDRAISTVLDPITLTKIDGIQGEGKIKSVLNVRGAVTSKTLLTKDDKAYSSIKYRYDGLGRQVQEEDHLGRTTHYEMGPFDRITKATWRSGRVTHTEYSKQSSSILPVSFKLGNRELGVKSFDGLDRITSSTVGTRTVGNEYEETHTEPRQITLPSGYEFTLDYEPELNYAVTKVGGSDQEHVFKLDRHTGAPTLMENAHMTHRLQYYDTGLLSHEDFELHDNGATYSAGYTYSMAGKLQSYINVYNQEEEKEYNSRGQPNLLAQGPVKVNFTYDNAHRLEDSIITNTSDSKKLITHLVYDDFGRVHESTVTRGSTLLHKLVQNYGPTGLIKTRSLTTGSGSVLQDEEFEYDIHNRLIEYTCDGSEPPVNEHGLPLQSQSFTFDEFDNLSEVISRFQDGTHNTTSYTFASHDPTQLTHISSTHEAFPALVELQYNGNGSLTRDENGRRLSYDTLNRLSEVRDSDNQLLCQYRYDAAGKLVYQQVPGQDDTHIFYRGNSIVAIHTGKRRISFVPDGGRYWGQTVQEDGTTTSQVWASDEHHSILAWVDADQVHHEQYTPYGFSRLDGPSVGFNGQWRDPVTGWFHLGNGYRVYNPVLMRFHTPDPWSPFTSGEINPYAYCLGDPINRVDPSGHFGIEFGWKDLVMTLAGIAASTTLAVVTAGASVAIQIGLSVVVGVAVDFGTSLIYDTATGVDVSWQDIGVNAAIGALTGLMFGLGSEFVDTLRKPAQQVVRSMAKIAAEGAASETTGRLGSWLMVGGMTLAAKEIKASLAGEQGGGPRSQPVPYSQGIEAGLPAGPRETSGQTNQTVVATRDNIRPALKESQHTLRGYTLQQEAASRFATYGAEPNTGQSVANLLNRDLRAPFGRLSGEQDDTLVHGLGAQHRIRSMHDSIREAVRHPHRAADWHLVPGLGGSM